METADALRRRRMTRRFDPDGAVLPAQLDAVVDAAVRAPSAGFTQGVSYQVLVGGEVDTTWEVLARGEQTAWLTGMRTAPVLILAWTSEQAYLDRYAEPDKGWVDRDPERWSAPYWWVDAGMGVMAALLRATDLGLGSCFFGVPPERVAALRAAWSVPETQQSVGAIALGVPEAPGPPPRRSRRPRAALVHDGVWSASPESRSL